MKSYGYDWQSPLYCDYILEERAITLMDCKIGGAVVSHQNDVYSDLLITEKGQNVDELGWSASGSNTNNEQCGGAQRMPDKDNFNAVTNDVTYIVRRLIPKECARLQGFPDWWCTDVPHTDSAEYKMWGNGVALPCVLYVMEGIAEILQTKK